MKHLQTTRVSQHLQLNVAWFASDFTKPKKLNKITSRQLKSQCSLSHFILSPSLSQTFSSDLPIRISAGPSRGPSPYCDHLRCQGIGKYINHMENRLIHSKYTLSSTPVHLYVGPNVLSAKSHHRNSVLVGN